LCLLPLFYKKVLAIVPAAWCNVSAKRTEDRGFEYRQVVSFLGQCTLQCCSYFALLLCVFDFEVNVLFILERFSVILPVLPFSTMSHMYLWVPFFSRSCHINLKNQKWDDQIRQISWR
jgi:hypothetical protein